jgi:hypothetical protein
VTPLDKLEKFVADNYECSRAWAAGGIRDWLLWAFSHRFLFLVVGRNGYPAGMAIARPLQHYTDCRTEYHDPADNIYIDLTIGNKQSMKPLMAQIVNRFGVRKKIVFKRYGRSEGLKSYDFRKFSLKILRS